MLEQRMSRNINFRIGSQEFFNLSTDDSVNDFEYDLDK